jgi:hypothetical protein
LERSRLEPHSRKPIHSVMSAMIAASDGMLVERVADRRL